MKESELEIVKNKERNRCAGETIKEVCNIYTGPPGNHVYGSDYFFLKADEDKPGQKTLSGER